MGIKVNKYFENAEGIDVDITYYDSSNILFSECMDYNNAKKDLKIVFGKGQTYLYKEVDVNDYVMFKNSLSNGQAFHKLIKKYENERLADTDLNELNKNMQELINEQNERKTGIENNKELNEEKTEENGN